jgi:hypothetical protein
MKLIKVLMLELTKRDGWHPDAKYYAQDKCGRICAYREIPVKCNSGDCYTYSNMIGFSNNADFFAKKAEDWDVSIISKNDYYSCLKQIINNNV